MNERITIHTDGGARGNPGPAGLGIVLDIEGQHLTFKKYIGETTNNVAEYQAIIFGLEKAKGIVRNPKEYEVDIFLDSELVQSQLNQQYKVKDKDLAALFVKIWNLAINFKKVKYIHIYRNDNKEADRLVNQAIDGS